MLRFLLLSIVLLSSLGCGKKSSSSKKPSTEINNETLRPLEITQRETVDFVRKEQKIIRYDCNGHVTSNKLETINSLSKKLTINYENRKGAWSYSVYNRRTKSSQKGLLTENGRFIIDYAPTVFNMHVKEGINDIEYVFKKCPDIGINDDGGKFCKLEPVPEKEGMIQVTVNYSSEIVPGEQHIHRSEESCKPGIN